MGSRMSDSGVVIITGSSGFIGRALIKALASNFALVGFDRDVPPHPPSEAECVCIDLTSDDSVAAAFKRVRRAYGERIASVVHLAAYFDLTGRPNPKYEQVTVGGTERLLRALRDFDVEQFIFTSSMLAHRGRRPGETINEDWPLESNLPYRASKIAAERIVREARGSIPALLIRPAGLYDDMCRNAFIAHQIARIFERRAIAHVYPGNLETGQAYLHLEDMISAVAAAIDHRRSLPPETAVLLAEPETLSMDELQRLIGRLIHDEEWQTRQIPKELAKAGAWVETEVLEEQPFIQPWMVDIADDHYAVDITRARTLLEWGPSRSLRSALPAIIDKLKADPVGWYVANKLDAARVIEAAPEPHPSPAPQATEHHQQAMAAMRQSTLWTQFLVIALGAWLLTSPIQFSLFDPAAATTVRDLGTERHLLDPATRNALTAWSDVLSGMMLMLLGRLALSSRLSLAQWGTTLVGLWLIFAPLLFWTPSAGAYANDTLVGGLAIMLSVLVPMMPGMSHEGMMDESSIPPGWTYSPSSWLQRLPIIALGFFGFLIARYLAAYQLGHVGSVWDPFFSGDAAKNGTEFIITSDVSRAWPIPDGGLGAAAYLIEALMGAMGGATRWRTMPWMVTFFFILVVPLGAVSIFFIIIQPIAIGTYCTLCLIAAAAMLVMIPLTLDEVVAMAQYMLRAAREGRPFWRTFFAGGPDPRASKAPDGGDFSKPLAKQVSDAVRGVTIPWTLLATCGLGVWLMIARAVFGTEGGAAANDHLTGALLVTVAVCAMAEVARPLRFINVLFGLWLLVAPWVLSGANVGGRWNDVVVGLIVCLLSLPRGRRSGQHYGSWDRYLV